MTNKTLYRGVNANQLQDIIKNQAITPYGTENAHTVHYGLENIKIECKHGERISPITHDGSATYGASKQNTNLLHQKDSSLFPTARVSTTPILERAIFYATKKYQNYDDVYILQFKNLSTIEGFELYDVNTHITNPTCPEDEEVEISYQNNQAIPLEFIEKIFKILPNNELVEVNINQL